MGVIRRRWILYGILLMVAGGCAAGGGATGTTGSGSSMRNVIGEAELEGMGELNVYEAVRRLKPTWLRYRGQSVLTAPEREGLKIYLDGSYYGEPQSLEGLRVRNIQQIQFLDAREATLRLGTGHTVGALLLTSRKG